MEGLQQRPVLIIRLLCYGVSANNIKEVKDKGVEPNYIDHTKITERGFQKLRVFRMMVVVIWYIVEVKNCQRDKGRCQSARSCWHRNRYIREHSGQFSFGLEIALPGANQRSFIVIVAVDAARALGALVASVGIVDLIVKGSVIVWWVSPIADKIFLCDKFCLIIIICIFAQTPHKQLSLDIILDNFALMYDDHIRKRKCYVCDELL